MADRTLTVQQLLRAGFERAGCWELRSEGQLSHPIELPTRAGVYAFAVDGIVQYVGLASRSVRQRLGHYRNPGPSQSTNIRLNEIIRGHVEQGSLVEILIAHPTDSDWNGLKVCGTEGLEAGLIADFDLPWNVRGSSPSEVMLDEKERTGAKQGSFYVYENWTVDKAIVHRADCSFCNNGEGIHGSGTTTNSMWHGPYGSAGDAMVRAKACRRTRTETCARCSRH